MFWKIKVTGEMTSSVSSMDISDSFRPEDLSKTDFFDFVSPPQQDISETTKNNSITVMGKGNEQPLQGFDQVRLLSFYYTNAWRYFVSRKLTSRDTE